MFSRFLKSLSVKSGMDRASLHFFFILSSSIQYFHKISSFCCCTSYPLSVAKSIGVTTSKIVKIYNFLKSFFSSFFKKVLSHTFEIKALRTPTLNWI